MFSFEYIIEPEVRKTEEDPQEQLQLKVLGGQSPTQMTLSIDNLIDLEQNFYLNRDWIGF